MKNSSPKNFKSLNFISISLFFISSLYAGYIPLTDSIGHEKSWVLFGVTGLKSTGAGSGADSGNFSITNDSKNIIIDTTKDEKFTEGLIDPLVVNAPSLGKLKSLTLPYIQVRIDTTDATFSATQPINTIYVTMEKDSGPDFVVSYASSLENRVMEYTIFDDDNNSNCHSVVLNSSHSYKNPAYGELIQSLSAMSHPFLSEVRDIVDFNLTDNPPIVAYYDIALNQKQATVNNFLRLYSYDSQNNRWNLFDTRNNDDVNDFTELENGRAYWGQMDGETNTTGGVVLGDSNISTAQYSQILTDGWNLISFNHQNSTIKETATGLILTLESNQGHIKIWNSSANSYTEISEIEGGDETKILHSCLNINQAIREAKIATTMPKSFYLKAFPISTTKIVLISNSRFIVDEVSGVDTLSAITTLTGAIPYKVNPQYIDSIDDTQEMNSSTVLDTDSYGAMSKYGEYSLIVEPLTGAGTASELSAKIKLQTLSDDATDAELVTIQTDTQTVANDLTLTTGGATFTSTALDTDYDSNISVDKILIASQQPFYIKDNTFSRVFSYSDEDNSSKLRVIGTGVEGEIEVNGVQSADEYATAINGNYNINANDIGDKIVIFSTAKDAQKFQLYENISQTTADQLEHNTTDNDLAKGAIKGVYSLHSFIKASLKNSINLQVDTPDANDDNVQISLKDIFGNIQHIDLYADDDTKDDDINWSIAVKNRVKELLKTFNLIATVDTNGSNGTNGTIDVNITGINLKDIEFNFDLPDDDNETNKMFGDANVTLGYITTVSPDLTDNLSFNPIHSSGYITTGPLYTIRDAGFDMKAMITANVNISDKSISWESIDLTKNDIFNSPEYTLFQTDNSLGYWVYLETKTKIEPVILDKNVKVIYSSHFNRDGTTYNDIFGSIAVNIDSEDSVVNAVIDGKEIELIKSKTSNYHIGYINSYELSLLSGNNYSIYLNISDTKGSNLLHTNIDKDIDFIKPSKPIVDIISSSTQPDKQGTYFDDNGTTVTLKSDTDVTGFYVFNGQIHDYKPLSALNKIGEFEKDAHDQYSFCSLGGINRLTTADQEAYHLNIIAVDGTGKLGGGNASDVALQDYIPILKNSIKLSDRDNNESDSTIQGTIYGADCRYSGKQDADVNYGMEITSEDENETVKIVYQPKGRDVTNPITLFFDGDGNITAKVTYSERYVGSIVYLDVNNSVYSYKLIDTGNDSDHPIQLNTDENVTKRPNQKL